MDAVESVDVMNRLRQGIVDYIKHINLLLSIREQPFLPVPFPDDPTRLPIDFPHGDCFHTFTIQWNDIEHRIQHKFEVKLLHFRSKPGEQYILWELVFKRWYSLEPWTRIGALLVDRAVYEDQPFYQITGCGVLLSLAVSVGVTEPVYIKKITLASPNAPSTLLEILQIDCNGLPIEPARGLPFELARREI